MTAVGSPLLKWMNIIAFALTVLANGLAGSTTIIGGRSTSQISDANPTLVTPAGYVFSIWGIIYILLGVFVVYQALPAQSGRDYHKKIGWLFVLSCLFNITWLFVWQFEYLSLSVLVMFLILASLIAIYLRLNIGKSAVSTQEKLAVHLPFSVYLGWITIASIADVATTLVSLKWDGFGVSQETWAILVLIVALIVTLVVIATRKDVAYALVIIWAFIGIAVKQGANPSVSGLAESGAIIIALYVIQTLLFARFRRR